MRHAASVTAAAAMPIEGLWSDEALSDQEKAIIGAKYPMRVCPCPQNEKGAADAEAPL
jgi:hypothetical protein